MKKRTHLISVSLVGVIALILVAVGASPARAADLYVPSSGYTTIQAAIDAAASGDTIYVAGGKYSEGLTIGKSLSIVGAGANQTFLDGGGANRVVQVSTSADVTFSDLTIQNGYVSEASDPKWKGGGIYNEGKVTAHNCTFTNNEATGDGGAGGGIYNQGKVIAHNCTFTNNKATGYGGAIDSYYYNPWTTGADVFPSITCTNCVFTGNKAYRGGAIGSVVYDYGDTDPRPTVITVTNCTFAGNFAVDYGGAVYFVGGELKATNCTISANHINCSGRFGGGIFAQHEGNMPETVATVTNCILWGNTYGWDSRDWNQIYIGPEGCSAAVTYSDVQGGWTGVGNLNADPRFARNPDPADNDYSDNDCGDLHLQMNSPCINVGNNSAVTAPPFPTNLNNGIIDLDGDLRIQDGVVNMGAYESLAPAANAGPDQSVEITHDGDPATNTAQVTLNGSGSDPDSRELTYAWTEGATELGTGASLSVALAEGKHTITLTVTASGGDMDRDTATDQVVIEVLSEPNEYPVANAGPDQPEATNPVALNGCLVVPDVCSYDPDGDQLTYEWSTCIRYDENDEEKGYICTEFATEMNTSASLSVGTHMIRLTVRDIYGAEGYDDILVTVLNTSPAVGAITINPVSPCPANTPLSATATFTDPDPDDTHTAVWDWGDGSTGDDCIGTLNEGSGSVSGSHTYVTDGTYTVTLTVTDAGGISGFSTCQYVVQSNRPPSVVSVTAPMDPCPVGTQVPVSATFTDPDPGDTHTAVWDWGNGSTSAGTVDEGRKSVSGSHTYAVAGIYAISLTVTDNNTGSGSSDQYLVVVYDPDGGFVTGGGWITSPAGAYRSNPTLTGKATFGFNSKYKKGANVPSGSTEFQFKAANLNFHSESYEWLVVAGAKAQYKGTGTINGGGNYGFMLTAIDGAINGGGGTDKFRIKIWGNSNNMIVYDNQLGESDTSDPTTVIGGGSIIIHKN